MDAFEAVFIAGFAIAYIIVVLLSLALGIAGIVARCKLFEKAGEPGWKGIIPVYYFWVMNRLATGKNYLAVIYLLLIIPYLICFLIGTYTEELVMFGLGMIFLLVMVALWCYIGYNFAKAYGKSTVFCIAFIFLWQYMILAMGFDKNTVYVGPYGESQSDFYY